MGNARLPVPVRRVLDESIDDAKLTRLWHGMRAQRKKKLVPARLAWVLAAVSAVLAAMIAMALLRSPLPSALHLADGRDVPAKMATGGGGRLAFDDASSLDVAPGTELDLLESTGHAFAMAMRTGTIALDVHPGGPRAWRIECGPVTVEVVGTRFGVERTARFVRVTVSRGAVVVRGELVPDRAVRLGPGQSIVVELPSATAAAGSTASREATIRMDELQPATAASGSATPMTNAAAPKSRPMPRAESAEATLAASSAAAPAMSAPAPAASSASAPVMSAPAPVASAKVSVDGELSRADALRRAGRFAEAASTLERVLAEHGTEPSAPVAEFSLGRLYLDSLGNPSLSATHFERSLARGLPVALSEDALGRLVEAKARCGDRSGACAAATRYHASYPGGRHLADVDRWCPSAR